MGEQLTRRPVAFLGWVAILVMGAVIFGSFNNRSSGPASQGSIERRTSVDQASIAQPAAQVPAIPSPLHSVSMEPTVLYVTATELNVRSRPDGTATVLLTAPKGAPVVAVGGVDGWYEVQLNDGSTGWMSSDYLSTSQPSGETENPVAAPKAPAVALPAYDRSAVISALIAASQRSYPGNCPCPENRMRNGRRCGGNSAWSKGSGYSPLCYPSDVTQKMIDDYLARH